MMDPHLHLPLLAWYVGEMIFAQGKLPKEDSPCLEVGDGLQ